MADARSGICVAIACYNHGHFLAEAIESCLAQTLLPTEIIVVDDGSSDNTAEVVRSFPGIRYVWKKNGGLSSARNAGLQQSKQDFILFLDADDRLLPTALESAHAALMGSPSAAFAFGGYREIDVAGNMLFEMHPDGARANHPGLLRGNHIAMHGTVLYRRDMLAASGGFDESLRACEDFDIYLRLSRSHPIRHYDASGAEYRRHEANMTRNFANMLRLAKRVLDKNKPGPEDENLLLAWREGRSFFEEYYGSLIVEQILRNIFQRRNLGAAWRDLRAGFEVDDHFSRRLAVTTWNFFSARISARLRMNGGGGAS